MSEIDTDAASTFNDAQVRAKSFKERVSSAAEQTSSSVTQSFKDAGTDLKTSIETNANTFAGEIKGGIESVRSEIDDVKDKINNPPSFAELKNDAAESLKNNVKSVIKDTITGALQSKFGVQVELEYDSDGYGNLVVNQNSVQVDGNSTIDGILKLLTGLKGGEFSLVKTVTDTATDKIVTAVQSQVGRIGSEASAQAVLDKADAYTKEFKDAVNGANIPDTQVILTLDDSVDPATGEVLTTTVLDLTSSLQNNTYLTGDELKTVITGERDANLTDISDTLVSSDLETKVDEDGLARDLAALTGDSSSDLVNLDPSSSQIQATDQANRYQSLLSSKYSNNSSLGLLEGLAVKEFPESVNLIRSIAPSISDSALDTVLLLAQGDAQDKQQCIRILNPLSIVSYDSLVKTIAQINTSITNATLLTIDTEVLNPPVNLSTVTEEQSRFTFVSSIEELEGVMSKVDRNVERMIVHWTETNSNRNIGARDIEEYQKETSGLSSIGYHLVILRDGSIQRGRELERIGEHTPSYDDTSIGVVFVGGINAPSGTLSPENFISPLSLTRAQFNSFDHICRAFFHRFDGGTIVGHNDLDPLELDPGFDVIDYVQSRFGKTYTIEDVR